MVARCRAREQGAEPQSAEHGRSGRSVTRQVVAVTLAGISEVAYDR